MVDVPLREQIEATLAEALGEQFATFRREVVEALGEPPAFEALTPELWQSIAERTDAAMVETLEGVYRDVLNGAISAAEIADFDPTLANTRAATWARERVGELIGGVNETSQARVRRAIERFYNPPQGETVTLDDVKNQIAQVFGAERAELIAITEITFAASGGELAAVQELAALGVVTRAVWNTSQDALVCPICAPRNGTYQGEFWENYPPAHPKCRCWVTQEIVTDA